MRIVAEPPEGEAEAAILAGLQAHNDAATGQPGRQKMMFALRDAAGTLQGGLSADLALGWLLVDKLWIAPGVRGQGQGAMLLIWAEDAAKAAGAVGAHLYTSTFQAPGFYARLGYEEIGRLPGRPAGHDRVWMAKRWG